MFQIGCCRDLVGHKTLMSALFVCAASAVLNIECSYKHFCMLTHYMKAVYQANSRYLKLSCTGLPAVWLRLSFFFCVRACLLCRCVFDKGNSRGSVSLNRGRSVC